MLRHLLPLCLAGCLVPRGVVDAYLDRDGDGERPAEVGGTDCDDADDAVNARAAEVCGNGLDDDCDGAVDDDGIGSGTFYVDADGDGVGDGTAPVRACVAPAGVVTVAGDCDDSEALVKPGLPEDCTDERDNDCDGTVDESDEPPLWWRDLDDDGHGDADWQPIASCAPVAGHTTVGDDCDDRDASSHPGADEVPYDGVDNACDGGNDFDMDGDGAEVHPDFAATPITAAGYPRRPLQFLDCDDLDEAVFPGAEEVFYDGVDADCDGADDFDADGDGHASDAFGGDDCDDTDGDVWVCVE